MNTSPKQSAEAPTDADERLIDLLVDGELDDDRRRTLLAELDRRPDGWRRCALAFLEAQAWREGLGRLPSLPPGEVPSDVFAASQGLKVESAPGGWWRSFRRSRGRSRSTMAARSAGILLAMAASFLVAFYLGTLLPPGQPGDVAAGPDRVALPAEEPRIAHAGGPGTTAGAAADGETWRLVDLPVDGGAPGYVLRVPAVERERLDEGWADALPPAFPEDLFETLRRAGHDVRRSRQYVPVPLDDGRQLVIPVDQIDVRYVGYQ